MRAVVARPDRRIVTITDNVTPQRSVPISQRRRCLDGTSRLQKLEGADTGSCPFGQTFATPGWPIPSVCDSHQYESNRRRDCLVLVGGHATLYSRHRRGDRSTHQCGVDK